MRAPRDFLPKSRGLNSIIRLLLFCVFNKFTSLKRWNLQEKSSLPHHRGFFLRLEQNELLKSRTFFTPNFTLFPAFWTYSSSYVSKCWIGTKYFFCFLLHLKLIDRNKTLFVCGQRITCFVKMKQDIDSFQNESSAKSFTIQIFFDQNTKKLTLRQLFYLTFRTFFIFKELFTPSVEN